MKHLRWSDSVWDRVQAVGCWILGLAGAFDQLFIRTNPQPELYPLIAALMAFPLGRAWDKGRRERSSRSQSDPGVRL